MECAQCYKYWYPGGISTKVPFTLTKIEKEEEEDTPDAPTTVSTTWGLQGRVLKLTCPPPKHESLRGYQQTFRSFQDPPTPPKAEIYLEKLAVDTLIKLTK